jgi:hypothetical protein
VREEDKVKSRDMLTFEVQFRVLKNVSGMFINSEIANIEALGPIDEVPLQRKCTCYWAVFTDAQGVEISTEKKCWLTDF